jgi:hypothetical protein
MHIARYTRRDILLALGILCTRMHDAQMKHWRAAIQIVRYLKSTIDDVMELKAGNSATKGLTVYSDASWANRNETLKSRSGTVIFYNGNPIYLASKIQKCVSNSSTQSEMIALSESARQVSYFSQLLDLMDLTVDKPISVYTDNQTSIRISENEKRSPATRHIQLADLYIKELVATGQVKLNFVRSQDNIADALTKPMPKGRFLEFKKQIGIITVRDVDGGVS